jgi:Bacterial protein of unknown function (DUF922)
MMRTFLFFIFLSAVMPFSGIAQDKNEELLEWSAGRRLNWADYKAKPDPQSDAAATTTSYLGISYNINPAGFSYKITCRFSKTRSWGLHKTDYILSHEQGHFDISEIFARKLNKRMSEYRFNKRNYQNDLDAIYQEIINEKIEMQNQYDRETNHSINKEKQAEWLKNIRIKLNELDNWSAY